MHEENNVIGHFNIDLKNGNSKKFNNNLKI